MTTRDMVDHECVADHCIACCPVARSYSDGFESAKMIYGQPLPAFPRLEPVWVITVCAVVMTIIVLRLYRRRIQEDVVNGHADSAS